MNSCKHFRKMTRVDTVCSLTEKINYWWDETSGVYHAKPYKIFVTQAKVIKNGQ